MDGIKVIPSMLTVSPEWQLALEAEERRKREEAERKRRDQGRLRGGVGVFSGRGNTFNIAH